jgi:hypothetical protein
MYNMDVSIGSYKFRLEILILIVVVFWIMFGHLLCGCSRVSLMEGMERIAEGLITKSGGSTPAEAAPARIAARRAATGASAAIPDIAMTTMATASREGFTGANNSAMGPEFGLAKTPGYIMNPSTWSMPTLTYSPGTTPDAGVKAIWDRPKQPIPLPKDELDMFATTPFAPECCPNAYSSSMGCACMTVDQYNYLRDRGGNNVPYDIY